MSTFQFTSVPMQCMPLDVRIVGGGGKPPYSLDMVPTNNSHPQITSVQFNETSLTLPSFAWPAGQQFVAMVSDQRGVGSIGTSLPITVANSNSTDCLSASNSPMYFSFLISSNGTQCGTVRIFINGTDPNTISPPVHVWFICPGAQSIGVDIPPGSVVPGTLSSFLWQIPLRGGTEFIMAAGDARVDISGALSLYTLPSSNDSSCLGPPPKPTPLAGQIVTASPGKHNNVGAIAGGTIGGLACIALIVAALYYLLRLRRRNREQEPYQTQPQWQQELDSELITYGQPTPMPPPLGENHHPMTSAGLVGIPQSTPPVNYSGSPYTSVPVSQPMTGDVIPPAYKSVE